MSHPLTNPEGYMVFIAEGQQYAIGPESDPAPSHWRGYGGRRWLVVFQDGRQFVTTNLWHHGRAAGPDTATLISQENPAPWLFQRLIAEEPHP